MIEGTQFRNWARNLAIDKMRNAISKLRKLPKSVEHKHLSCVNNVTLQGSKDAV